MQSRTTIHLSIHRWQLAAARARRWLATRDPSSLIAPLALALLCLLAAALIRQALRPIERGTAITPAPIILIATTRALPAPTAIPQPTPDQHLAEELARLQQRVAELEAAQQAQLPAQAQEPAVVSVEAPAVVAPAPAAEQQPAAPPEQPYQVTNEQPAAAPPPAAAPQQAQPAVAPAAPAPAAPAAAATPSLEESAARIGAAVEASGGQPSDRWREEHCFGDACY